MKLDHDVSHRRSIRLKGYDYTQVGFYFITICAHNHKCIFGRITDSNMSLRHEGKIAQDEWLKTAEMRPNISLGEFVIMPNHMHGIIEVTHQLESKTATCVHEKIEQFGKPVSNRIPTIVRGYKSAMTKRIKILRNQPVLQVWQRNYSILFEMKMPI
ncbi:MAG: transposase [Pseudomonadota bacterium]